MGCVTYVAHRTLSAVFQRIARYAQPLVSDNQMHIFRFFIFNLLGNILPILVALVSVPVIAHHAGVERLGALGVVWALVGYFGFLDFGLSRAVTRRVANAVEQGRLAEELTELRGFFWWWVVPVLLMIALSFLGLRALFAGYLPSGSMGQELTQAWAWIAWSIPVTLATNWLRGILEGLQRFARINLLRTIFGTWNYAVPAVAVLYLPTLEVMIASIVLGRILALVAHGLACLQAERGIVLGPAPRRLGSVRLFLMEGGWMTVSNLIGPLMVYFDRFVLAALLPANAVAWYVTSQEVMLRTLLIPGALAGVLFPKFSGASNSAAMATHIALYQRGIRVVAALMLPLCVLAAAGAYDAMRIWMGEPFALNSHRVVEIIAVGIFANSIAQMPFAWLQGMGRSRLTAQLHIVEFPLYAAGLYFCVVYWGIVGAAWMWTFRVLMDCLLLLRMAAQRGAYDSHFIVLAGIALVAMVGFFTGPGWHWEWRAGVCAVSVGVAFVFAWFGLLNKEDRDGVLGFRYAH